MFHVNCTARMIGGDLHYFITISVLRHGTRRICGVLTLRGVTEWSAFREVCEARQIEVSIETLVQTQTPETAPAE